MNFKRVVFLVSLFLSVGLLVSTDIARASVPEINIYAQLPRTSDVRISPDGRHLAMISPYKDSEGVFIYDLANPTNKVRVIPTPKQGLIKYIGWGSDKHIIMRSEADSPVMSSDLRGYSQQFSRWYSTNIETQKTAVLLRDRIEKNGKIYTVMDGGSLTHRLPNDPDYILMNFPYYTNTFMDGYWRVNLDSGKSRAMANLPRTTANVVFSSDGTKIIAREEYDRNLGDLRVYSGEYPDEKLMVEESFPTSVNRTTFLRTVSEGKLVMQQEGPLGFNVYTIDGETGKIGDFSYDVSIPSGVEIQPLFAPFSREYIGVGYTDDYDREAYFAQPYKGWVSKVSKVMPNLNVRVLSHTRDEETVIVFVEGQDQPGEYFLFEPNKGSISSLGGRYPELKAEQIAKTIRVDFDARDGVDIPAYVTLPHGESLASKNLPLVVMPHGGPVGVRDDASFDFWAQYLAAQGYAVFKPQFRGSGGFGYRHLKRGDGEFGEAMLTDTIDGIKSLVSKGLIDADKICVTGASYGGYQALALPMIEPDMFKCAISVNGVSDMEDMLKYTKKAYGVDSGAMKFWNRIMGISDGGMEKLRSQSPALNAEKIKAEIVLIHGENDDTVPIQQTKAMAKALKKAGRSDDIIMLEDDDHNLSLPESRMKLLKASDELFSKHLK